MGEPKKLTAILHSRNFPQRQVTNIGSTIYGVLARRLIRLPELPISQTIVE